MASKKNEEVADPNVPRRNGEPAAASGSTIDDSDYQEVQVGFAPYFSPSEGAKFHGRLLDADATNPAFIRFTFEALTDLECFTGPADEQDSVLVRKGEVFTVSAFAQVRFEEYGGMKMIVEFKEKVKTSTVGRSVWLMGLKLHKDDYAIVQARRHESMAARVQRAQMLKGEVEAALARQKSLQQPQAVAAQ
jgi:hypothetical protein